YEHMIVPVLGSKTQMVPYFDWEVNCFGGKNIKDLLQMEELKKYIPLFKEQYLRNTQTSGFSFYGDGHGERLVQSNFEQGLAISYFKNLLFDWTFCSMPYSAFETAEDREDCIGISQNDTNFHLDYLAAIQSAILLYNGKFGNPIKKIGIGISSHPQKNDIISALFVNGIMAAYFSDKYCQDLSGKVDHCANTGRRIDTDTEDGFYAELKENEEERVLFRNMIRFHPRESKDRPDRRPNLDCHVNWEAPDPWTVKNY
ncbi:MAG: hypothetical protein NT001_06320, partial [Candidatus Woesearchaeota archaeon]|nr:hypothetical protein [Candidatus Woesearchaeota archaeon]